MSFDSLLVCLILFYLVIKFLYYLKSRLLPVRESLISPYHPSDGDTQYISDLIDTLQLPNDDVSVNDTPDTDLTKGIELTFPNLGEKQIYYPSIITYELRQEIIPIIEYVLNSFNTRINQSLPENHRFSLVSVAMVSKQPSISGNIYQVRFFAKDSHSSITLNIQSEVVQLADSNYLNYVRVVGGDPSDTFGFSGFD
jgi:hypothetical protein